MTPEQWQQVKLTLERALDRPPADRRRFVEDVCGDDENLRREVENLLESHEKAGDFLTGSPQITETEIDYRAGTILKDRYRIQEKLGSGGVGVVHVADDLNLASRKVVVKFLHHDFRNESTRLTKFRQEVEALARLDHPSIVTAFDAGETPEGVPFLVMQYVEGRTLRQVLNEGGPLPLASAASVIRQLGDALKYAHEQGIIHRDLKPENVMVAAHGRKRENVKLIDFGVARVERSQVPAETGLFSFAGTPAYMAPEHLAGKPTAASDIFSLGVLAYEMLTGRRPFSYTSIFQLRDLQRKGIQRGGIRQLRPQTPVRAEELIRRALSYDAVLRPTDAHDFAHSLAAELDTSSPPLQRRIWLAGGAALALAGVAGVIMTRTTGAPIRRRDGNVLAEKMGAADPLQEGFQASPDIQGAPMRNRFKTGFDRWRMWSREEAGSYSHALTDEEKTEALTRGWRISLRGYPIIGNVHAVIDFQGFGPRYDVSYGLDDKQPFVTVCTQHEPLFEGPRVDLHSNLAHLLELTYRPQSSSCELSINGEKKLSDYKGHTQQQGPRGFFFGVSVYKSDRAEAVIDLVRFELLQM